MRIFGGFKMKIFGGLKMEHRLKKAEMFVKFFICI